MNEVVISIRDDEDSQRLDDEERPDDSSRRNNDPKAFLIDIFTLGSKVFDSVEEGGCGLRSLLENEGVQKVIVVVNSPQTSHYTGQSYYN